MSKDSSANYLHMHHPHLADHFEEFCRPPSRNTNPQSSTTNPPTITTNPTTTTNPNPAHPSSPPPHMPGTFLPFEEIHLPPHLMPVNPEDEDDVVPDMHAAFGINQALGQHQDGGAGVKREPVWRDLGLEELLRRGPAVGEEGLPRAAVKGRREGKRVGMKMLR